MFFLCPTHRHQLAALSSDDLEALWLRWLNQAGLHYGFHQWREALPYIGCAYDLAEDRLWRSTSAQEASRLRFVLSSIYLINTCQHLGDWRRLNRVLRQSDAFLAHLGSDPDVRRYRSLLLNPSRHAPFFSDHLNLPFLEVPQVQTCH